jgi:Carboxypeptidase regulatory-like domain
MKFLARLAIVLVLLICVGQLIFSQPQIKKPLTGSISGKVTVKGKGLPGISVSLRAVNSPARTNTYRGTTDQEGKYRISNVPPGSYQIAPDTPVLVPTTESPMRILILGEGETADDIDFALVRGGVITGRITNSGGQPLIEQPITLLPVESNSIRPGSPAYAMGQRALTDDRGIYRVFGVPKGNYKVAVGQTGPGYMVHRSRITQTFYPSVTDPSKATAVEVTEGSEATNIDIVVETNNDDRTDRFAVSGRIIDGESELPIPNMRLSLQRLDDNQTQFMNVGSLSDSQGRFKIENLSPGKYAVLIPPSPAKEISTDLAPFEIVDKDVTGVLVKTVRTTSVSGVVVLENTDNKSARTQLDHLSVMAYVQSETSSFGQSSRVNLDGTFHVGGLRGGGTANFSIRSSNGEQPKGLTIARIEHDGILQPRGIEIKDGEQLTGVRLVVTYSSGSIRGVVKVINGELPPTARIAVWFSNSGSDSGRFQTPYSPPSLLIDSRGHFLAEGLAAGSYEVNATVLVPNARTRSAPVKQQVNVVDGTVTDVVLTVDLASQSKLP